MIDSSTTNPLACSDPLDFARQLRIKRMVSALRAGKLIDGSEADINEAFRLYVALSTADAPKQRNAA